METDVGLFSVLTPLRAQSLQLCPTLYNPMNDSPPGSSVHGFSSQGYWSGLPCPPLGDLADPGIEPTCPAVESEVLTTGPPEISPLDICISLLPDSLPPVFSFPGSLKAKGLPKHSASFLHQLGSGASSLSSSSRLCLPS